MKSWVTGNISFRANFSIMRNFDCMYCQRNLLTVCEKKKVFWHIFCIGRRVMSGKNLLNTNWFILLVISLMLFALSSSGATNYRKECAICGMWIDQYEHTHHLIVLNDGKTEHFCSFACAAKYIRVNRDHIKTIMAADFITKSLIDANDAYYVKGSNVPGVMSFISMIAFATREQAVAFQAEHGGEIVTFNEALSAR
jgi:hypothetical protein